MTRAKRHLTICSMKYHHGKRVKASRFVREVDLVIQGKDPQEIVIEEASSLAE